MEREAIEKRDPNVDYLRVYAGYIAAYLEENNLDEITHSSLETIFGTMARERGYTTPDCRDCIALLEGMHIMEKEDNKYTFSSDFYREFFLNEFFQE